MRVWALRLAAVGAILSASIALFSLPPAGVETLAILMVGAWLLVYWFLRQEAQHQAQLENRVKTLAAENEVQTLDFARLRRRFISFAEGLPIPILIGDQDANLRFVNHTAYEWFGYRPLTGKSIIALTFCYDLYVLYLHAVQRRYQLTSEIVLSYPRERHVVASIWYLGDDGNTPLFAVALLDKSELVRLEQVRRDFVANVSHEFRTPLASIRSLAETLLHDGAMPPETRERFLQLIVQETERLARIADDLLVLSRAESLPPEKEPVDLAPIIRSVVQQVQGEAKEREVTIECELQEPLRLLASRDQMVQVLLNLLTNAIRYNKQGGHVWVRAAMRDGFVVVEVQDTGIGIPSSEIPRIFERFYRVDKTRSRDTGGTGLGLSIVKHIVESHGGRVEVESEYRVGSTFRVWLPVEESG
ncbi:MAG: PAS domain-containing sensor histidine kinase [Armatimonadetes bacterium]|nr:PAS domain-containing sensor histidine kinase [Armatimonadota bacterium]CUU34306.1 two-component system, OmpR family, phosphate regulon sensor histidine kinase PhoR [Armatimonadetes bacterium DC]